MRTRCVLSVLVALVIPAIGWAEPPLTSLTVRLLPQNPVSLGCDVNSSENGLAAQYSYASGQSFTFTDPLPTGAALSYMTVTTSLLGACGSSNSLQVTLNPSTIGVPIEYLNMTPFLHAASVASCSPIAAFSKGTTIGRYVSGYRRNSQNTLQVAELADGTCGNYIEFIDVTLYYWTDLPTITFDVKDATPEEERIILMHKFRSDDSYPSSRQTEVAPTANPDGNVVIRGTAKNADGTPYANQPIYLRQLDPEDASAYVPGSRLSKYDNLLIGSTAFTDDGRTSLPTAGQIAAPWYVKTTDAQGGFKTIMHFGGRAGGDNVAALASGVPLALPFIAGGADCLAEASCYRSGVFTAWRRVYLEVDRMFRQGAFITSSLLPGMTQVDVEDATPWANAKASNPIPIRLIHSAGGDTVPGSEYMEDHRVVGVKGRRLTLDTAVTQEYYALHSAVDNTRWAGDAVGRPDGSKPTYTVSPSLIISLMQDAYVQYTVLSEAMPYFPFLADCGSVRSQSQLPYCTEVASRWFDQRVNSGRNHQHVVAANYGGPQGIGDTALGQYGTYPNVAFVWVGQIETVTNPGSTGPYAGKNAVIMANETALHEVVHLYGVNPPVWESDDLSVPRTLGHCDAQSWDGTGSCLMRRDKTADEMSDGRVALHVLPGTVNCHGACLPKQDVFGYSEYRWIRTQADPLPEVMQKNRDAW